MLLRACAGAARRGWCSLGLVLLVCLAASAQAQVEMPESNTDDPVTFAADEASHWTQGAYEVWLLHGKFLLSQGLTYARASDAVLWIERGASEGDPHKIIAYLEGDVTLDYQQDPNGIVKGSQPLRARVNDRSWLGRFYTTHPLKIQVNNPGPEPRVKPPVFERGMAAREPKFRAPVRSAQFAEPLPPPNSTSPVSPGPPTGLSLPPGTDVPFAPGQPPVITPPPVGQRRLRVFPRSDVRVQAQWFPNQAANEWIATITSGVNLVVDGLENFGSIDVATDRLVIWTAATQEPLLGGEGALQNEDTPLELYMEGHIVFRQGDRIIYADRMYYDVRRQVGVVLDADMIGPVPTFDGLLHLRAKVLQQVGPDRFVGQNVSLTSSRLGVPTYDFQTAKLNYEDKQQPLINPFTGQAEVDPATGEPLIEHQRLASSTNNFLYIGRVPVFYWPYMATDLEQPNYYINNVQVRSDKIFGTQVLVDLNPFQLLGIKRKPQGVRWDISTDYFSKRGPALGTSVLYDRANMFGFPGRYYGLFESWGIDDHGLDNLGLNRRTEFPENGPWRGRILARHRQYFPDNYRLTAELGLISDYNFLEQYFENEWDQLKDQSTGLEFKHLADNSSWSITGDLRPNPFFTDTQWLPRFDHYLMGQSLFGDRLTYYEHSSIGYGQFRVTERPTNPEDLAMFGLLPWESVPGLPQTPANVQGGRYATSQEVDLPLSLGPVKIVPYLMGQAAHWDQVLNHNDSNRLYGQAGVRASIPFWSADSNIDSQMLNVHGLAHKVVFEADLSASEATQNLSNYPLYDNIDDNAIERYRRIFAFTDFGGPAPVPTKFDERFFLLRQGLAGWVASPSTEIAGTLAAARFDINQRWQTKRGFPGQQRIVDWMVLDTQAIVFPDPSRDNFGQVLGQLTYDYRWYLGDRTTVVSDGFYDFFSQGAKYFTVGAYLNRPPRGTLYTGIRLLGGPISSTVLSTSYSYRMSPKWISTFGTTYSLGHSGNIGQNFALTRIGESFLFSAAFNVDASKGNVGATFSLQPRFLSRALGGAGGLGTGTVATGGLPIPAAGVNGLE